MLFSVCLCTWLAISIRTGGAQDTASDEDACLAQTKLAVLRKQVSDLSADGDTDEEPEVNPDHPDDFEPPEHGYDVKSEKDTGEVEPSLFQKGSNCYDNPSGWYDSDGHHYHCGWYGQGDRCQRFGHGYARLGKTASEACCVCGGGGAAHAPGSIVTRHNGFCLDMHLGSSKNVYVHPCHGDKNQIWYIENNNLKNLESGQNFCLTEDQGNSARYNLYMAPCHDGFNQKFNHVGDAIFRANKNPHSAEKFALDVNFDIENNVYIHPWHGDLNQQWDINGALAIHGYWQPLKVLQRNSTELKVMYGTKKTSVVTKSKEWAKSVNTSLSTGEAAFGVNLSAEVSAEIGLSLSVSQGHEFEVSREKTIKFGFEFIRGKQQYLWQWQYHVDTEGAESVTTKTKDYSLTAGRFEPPKCFPGYCQDVPTCQVCTPPGSL